MNSYINVLMFKSLSLCVEKWALSLLFLLIVKWLIPSKRRLDCLSLSKLAPPVRKDSRVVSLLLSPRFVVHSFHSFNVLLPKARDPCLLCYLFISWCGTRSREWLIFFRKTFEGQWTQQASHEFWGSSIQHSTFNTDINYSTRKSICYWYLLLF